MSDTLRERIAQQIDKLDWYECTVEETLDVIVPEVEQAIREEREKAAVSGTFQAATVMRHRAERAESALAEEREKRKDCENVLTDAQTERDMAEAELTTLREALAERDTQIERLRLERDSAQAQFDRHVEWAARLPPTHLYDERIALMAKELDEKDAQIAALPDKLKQRLHIELRVGLEHGDLTSLKARVFRALDEVFTPSDRLRETPAPPQETPK